MPVEKEKEINLEVQFEHGKDFRFDKWESRLKQFWI